MSPKYGDNGTCRHHWVIEPPNGPFSRGECRVCREVRQFKNSIDAVIWVGAKSAPVAKSQSSTA